MSKGWLLFFALCFLASGSRERRETRERFSRGGEPSGDDGSSFVFSGFYASPSCDGLSSWEARRDETDDDPGRICRRDLER